MAKKKNNIDNLNNLILDIKLNNKNKFKILSNKKIDNVVNSVSVRFYKKTKYSYELNDIKSEAKLMVIELLESFEIYFDARDAGAMFLSYLTKSLYGLLLNKFKEEYGDYEMLKEGEICLDSYPASFKETVLREKSFEDIVSIKLSINKLLKDFTCQQRYIIKSYLFDQSKIVEIARDLDVSSPYIHKVLTNGLKFLKNNL